MSMNIPNTISIARLALAPVMMLLLSNQAYIAALIVFALASLSDGLDGFLARHLNQKTELGALLDPIADKVLINSALLTLTSMGLAPLWFCAIILGRDLFIGLGYLLLKITGQLDAAKVTNIGKTTTFAQMACLAFLIWTQSVVTSLGPLVPVLALLCAALTLASGAAYLWRINQFFRSRA